MKVLVLGILRLQEPADMTRLAWPLEFCDQLALINEMDDDGATEELKAMVLTGPLQRRCPIVINTSFEDRQRVNIGFWYAGCLAAVTKAARIEPTYVWHAPLGFRFIPPSDLKTVRRMLTARAEETHLDGFYMWICDHSTWRQVPLWRWRSDSAYEPTGEYPQVRGLEAPTAFLGPLYDKPVVTPSTRMVCWSCHHTEVFLGQEKEPEVVGGICSSCFLDRSHPELDT